MCTLSWQTNERTNRILRQKRVFLLIFHPQPTPPTSSFLIAINFQNATHYTYFSQIGVSGPWEPSRQWALQWEQVPATLTQAHSAPRNMRVPSLPSQLYNTTLFLVLHPAWLFRHTCTMCNVKCVEIIGKQHFSTLHSLIWRHFCKDRKIYKQSVLFIMMQY